MSCTWFLVGRASICPTSRRRETSKLALMEWNFSCYINLESSVWNITKSHFHSAIDLLLLSVFLSVLYINIFPCSKSLHNQYPFYFCLSYQYSCPYRSLWARKASVVRTRRSQGNTAMDFPAQANIQKDVTCPICLELLTMPLSLDCGHSFCQACITAKSMESGTHQGEEGTCPVCQCKYQFWNLRPNQPLANIAKKVRENMSPQKQKLCEVHGEKLLTFCKEDGKAICQHCAQSAEHRGHQIFFIEKVIKEYQVGPRVKVNGA